MGYCGRKRKNRNIAVNHQNRCFKPCGIRGELLETIIVYEDEIEAIRLADYKSLYQQDAADNMGISRSTFSRLVESARGKIAKALIENKKLEVISRDNRKESC